MSKAKIVKELADQGFKILSPKTVEKRLKARGKRQEADIPDPTSPGRGRPKAKTSEAEGARLDPETGGSARVGREVEGRRVQGQEKITRGKESVPGGIVKESTSKGAKARAKTKVQLEALVRKGKATPAQKRRLKEMEAKDVADTSRAARTAAATRRANAAKTAGKDKRDPRDVFMQTGEIVGDYNPTPREINQALSNLQARKTDPKIRERIAILEKKATGAKTLGRKSGGLTDPYAAIERGNRMSKMEADAAKAMEKKKELKSVPSGNKGLKKLPPEARNKMGYKKAGGSMKKKGYESGGSICKPRGVGCAMRGYGKAMKG
jgi:hypothetical protein